MTTKALGLAQDGGDKSHTMVVTLVVVTLVSVTLVVVTLVVVVTQDGGACFELCDLLLFHSIIHDSLQDLRKPGLIAT